MAVYKAPLREMRFILNELFNIGEHLQRLPNAMELDPETTDAVLDEAAKVAENVLFPLNRIGDEEGCRLEGSEVLTPSGFKAAFKTYTEAGWAAIGGHVDYGGQDLPKMLQVMIEEMMYSSNSAFFLYSSLSNGAYQALMQHGEQKYRDIVLPKLMSGEWCGTMCLTESHAGTDLGLIKSKALPNEDGSYSLTGSKIFITGGEHDMAENIVHLVLAKLPDAPAGSRGISLFLVPKFCFDEQGKLGERNPIFCGSIEKKMGIKGSSTCVMNLDGARGFLIGEPHAGLKCMFTMMNTERLSIGLQGLGSSEIAYQSAVDYAKERLQGRGSEPDTDKAADSIMVHPDVRRMLLSMRAYNEAMRAFAAWTGQLIDLEKHSADPVEQEKVTALVALLTPVNKAFFTDVGFEMSNLGMQVLGGHGYVSEWGMEQFVRDCRIAQIYEGTNGVQALDLTGRKLVANGGQYFQHYRQQVDTFLASVADVHALTPYYVALKNNTQLLVETTEGILERSQSNKDEIGAASVDYLRLFGLNICAFMWLRMMAIAVDKSDDSFYQAKLKVGKFFFDRLLPEGQAYASKVAAGADSMMALESDLF